MSRALKARVAGFASKHGLDQAASAKLRGTTDRVAWDVVEHGISGRVRNPSAYVSRMVTAKEREEKRCWDNEEQWVDDDWTEDEVGGQCTEKTVLGEDGEQETEVASEGEHGDQSAGGAGEYEDGEGRHWAEEWGDDYSERWGVDTAWGDDGWEAHCDDAWNHDGYYDDDEQGDGYDNEVACS